MAKQTARTSFSPAESSDRTSTSEDQEQTTKPSTRKSKKESIKNYVNDILSKHGGDEEQRSGQGRPQIRIETGGGGIGDYENVSAFQRYHPSSDRTTRVDAQRPGTRERQDRGGYASDDESEDNNRREGPTASQHSTSLEDSTTNLNFDYEPLVEERESQDQVYKQKVFLRQLQPPTPQPVEIQVKEVLIKPQVQRPPIHVRVAQREPRTPSPIVIKTVPPRPPEPEPDQPIIYNKYVPAPQQPGQQVIIHRYPDLPPKPRNIIVEQWLPYKPAPKRIIKQSLPPEALRTPPPPHNIIFSYAKPRALIEVELIRLPVLKVDPYQYQQMSGNAQQQLLMQYPTYQYGQQTQSMDGLARASQSMDQLNWRI